METRERCVLQDEATAVKRKRARKLVAKKVPDASHQPLETMGVGRCVERNPS